MASGGWLGKTLGFGGGGGGAKQQQQMPTPAVAASDLTAKQTGTAGVPNAQNTRKRGKGSLYVSGNSSSGGGTGLNI